MERTVFIALELQHSKDSNLRTLLFENGVNTIGGILVNSMTVGRACKNSRLESLVNPQIQLVNDMEIKQKFKDRLEDVMYKIASSITPGFLIRLRPVVSPKGFLVLEPTEEFIGGIYHLREDIVNALHLKSNGYIFKPHVLIGKIDSEGEQQSLRLACTNMEYDYPVSRLFVKINSGRNTEETRSFSIHN